MIDFKLIYNKYKDDLSWWREYLYTIVDDIIRITFNKYWHKLPITDDLRNTVFIDLDEAVTKEKYPLTLYCLNAIQKYIRQYNNNFVTVPLKMFKKLNEKRLRTYWTDDETGDCMNIWDVLIEDVSSVTANIQEYFTKKILYKLIKLLSVIEQDVITMRYLINENIPKIARNNAICKKYKIRQNEIYKIENAAFIKLRSLYEQHYNKTITCRSDLN